tara:strand:- start:260 stop:898 length:639 start_codon:yes stop_codon:yes gene_type:complete
VNGVNEDSNDKFEDEIIKQLMELFSGMNLPMDEKMFSGMVKDMIKQFDMMGIDPKKFDSKEVNFNIDVSSIKDAISGGADLAEMFNNLGFRVEQKPSRGQKLNVEVEEDSTSSLEEIKELPTADWYLDGWHLHATTDISKYDVVDDDLSLHLVNNGRLLEIFSTSQVSPLKRIRLPQSCDTLEEWDLNNGIMDLKLRLKPPNSNGIISIEEE